MRPRPDQPPTDKIDTAGRRCSSPRRCALPARSGCPKARRPTASRNRTLLRRADGSSCLHDRRHPSRYTSQPDPRRRTAHSRRRRPTPTGRAVDASAVELALLEIGRQRHRLRCRPGSPGPCQMCTSGARLRAGDRARRRRKDHRHARPQPWPGPHGGGQVVGLAPIRRRSRRHSPTHTGVHADTLAKLTWGLAATHDLPRAGRATSAGARWS